MSRARVTNPEGDGRSPGRPLSRRRRPWLGESGAAAAAEAQPEAEGASAGRIERPPTRLEPR